MNTLFIEILFNNILWMQIEGQVTNTYTLLEFMLTAVHRTLFIIILINANGQC